MQIDQLEQGLAKKFSETNIVFWYDPEQSFQDIINQLSLPDVQLVNMANESALEVKKWILRDNPEQAYLLYFPSAEPKIEENWLLDVSFYSGQFYADNASMLLAELGIKAMSLREHIKARASFFTNKQRTESLKRRITENETEQSLDLKMISVLAANEPILNNILMELFSQYAGNIEEAAGHDDSELILLQQLSKHGLLESFWLAVEHQFGYVSEERSVSDFLYKLFCTELSIHIDVPESEKAWASANVIPSASGRASASAFMLEWRDSKRFSQDHDAIAKVISDELNIPGRFDGCSPLALQECYTFEAVEQSVIRGLVRYLLHDDSAEQILKMTPADFEYVISKRLSGHWSEVRTEYAAIYQALKSSDSLFKLRRKFADGFNYPDAKAMFNAYSEELFLFDQHYRLFNQYTDRVQSKGGDILRRIDDAVESLYVDWYLYELGLAWDSLLNREDRIDNWNNLGSRLQNNFYANQVKQTLDTSKTIKRVFVIISDALRYEVADELKMRLNSERRFKSELKPMQGVLPSYTQLGMASLLPHSELDYDANSATVLVDGKSTSGLDNRNNVLQQHNGIAISSKDLLSWTQKQGREVIQDKSVVYIYHDTIDAIGDKGGTEHKTFEACHDAVEELKDLVSKAINNLNANRVLVTADHGFLFQQKGLTQPEKTGLGGQPTGAFEAKKRYILGRSMPNHEQCWHGSIANTTTKGSGSDVDFLLPKGANRFHFVGGARFVHGGAMPQEICIPLLEVKALRGKKAAANEKQKVGIITEKSTIRLVNQIEKIRFIQTNAVGNSYIERKVTAVIKDSQGNPVSSEETLLFDATSDNMTERTREARFKLIGSDFNRNENYQLFVIDSANNTVVEQFPRPVMIDLLDRDDFGF